MMRYTSVHRGCAGRCRPQRAWARPRLRERAGDRVKGAQARLNASFFSLRTHHVRSWQIVATSVKRLWCASMTALLCLLITRSSNERCAIAWRGKEPSLRGESGDHPVAERADSVLQRIAFPITMSRARVLQTRALEDRTMCRSMTTRNGRNGRARRHRNAPCPQHPSSCRPMALLWLHGYAAKCSLAAWPLARQGCTSKPAECVGPQNSGRQVCRPHAALGMGQGGRTPAERQAKMKERHGGAPARRRRAARRRGSRSNPSCGQTCRCHSACRVTLTLISWRSPCEQSNAAAAAG